MFETINSWAQANSPTIGLLSLIVSALLAFLTFRYVHLTRSTFIEIKKQTDHMTMPFIVIDSIDSTKNPQLKEASIGDEATALYDKWRTIVSRLDPNAISEKETVGLRIKNIGKSDALECVINVNIKVNPTNRMVKENTHGEKISFQIRIDGNIPAGTELIHPIGWIGGFPEIEYIMSVSYTDQVNNTHHCNKFAAYQWKNALLGN